MELAKTPKKQTKIDDFDKLHKFYIILNRPRPVLFYCTQVYIFANAVDINFYLFA